MNKSLVHFTQLQDSYNLGQDIIVLVQYAQGLRVSPSDWIGIFGGNWTSLDQYLVYERAPIPSSSQLSSCLAPVLFQGSSIMKQVQDRQKNERGGGMDVSYQLVFVSTVFNAVLGLSRLFSLMPPTSSAYNAKSSGGGLLMADISAIDHLAQNNHHPNLQQLVEQEKHQLLSSGKGVDGMQATRARSRSIPNISHPSEAALHQRPMLPPSMGLPPPPLYMNVDPTDKYSVGSIQSHAFSNQRSFMRPHELDPSMRECVNPAQMPWMNRNERQPMDEEYGGLKGHQQQHQDFNMRMQMIETQEYLRSMENMLMELRMENESLESSLRQSSHQKLMMIYETENAIGRAKLEAVEIQNSYTNFLHSIYNSLYMNGFQSLQIPNGPAIDLSTYRNSDNNMQLVPRGPPPNPANFLPPPPPMSAIGQPMRQKQPGWMTYNSYMTHGPGDEGMAMPIPKPRYSLMGNDVERRGGNDYYQWLAAGNIFNQPQSRMRQGLDIDPEILSVGSGSEEMQLAQNVPPSNLYRKNGSTASKRSETKRSQFKQQPSQDQEEPSQLETRVRTGSRSQRQITNPTSTSML